MMHRARRAQRNRLRKTDMLQLATRAAQHEHMQVWQAENPKPTSLKPTLVLLHSIIVLLFDVFTLRSHAVVSCVMRGTAGGQGLTHVSWRSTNNKERTPLLFDSC